MKNVSKKSDPDSITAKTSPMTVTEFLQNMSETFRASERRFFSQREASDLIVALRAALASPAHLLPQDAVTQECYRYLTIVNRTPISGLSLIACLGTYLARQVSLSSRLQAIAEDLTDGLRKGTIKPDGQASPYDVELYLEYVELLSYASVRFDVNIEDLDLAITPSSTYHNLRDFIFRQFNENPNVPESFIEAFILAHAYLYRLSLLE